MRRWLKQQRGFLLVLLGMGLLRTAIADWNPIPSGSMRPTLLEGDVVFVNRLAYDLKLPLSQVVLAHLGDPQRGDIVTFWSPKDGTRLIKRVVGLPGDRVEIRDGRLVLNGQPQDAALGAVVSEPLAPGLNWPAQHATEQLGERPHAVQFLGGPGNARQMAAMTVPEGEFFMLGDNRDNSEDSRFIGTVPRALLIGRAVRTLVSVDILDHWQPRLARTGAALR